MEELREAIRRNPDNSLEQLEWYELSPFDRFLESQRLWETFALLGGDVVPEPDSESPFDPART
ncbi:MAG: hypothetical protein HY814_08400 [Candidatus Riflebacteria bacterium]|nr:hypothetical protein [Candidatus Riflebacteria bacterium]